ncbi:DMT family transporter [Williamsia muralis]|uniref:SMR family transporter n=1 Tax=Williamsia marianensis TaxID=85044 RepID=A0ABU4EST3_WILMA|nr:MULTISPECIES: SMR family transporter [Williamsia]MDV7134317.1 SMR family transporter [Williamsia muralis]PVY31588.1 small multidrug resistance pump [Williamsia marianensis]
MTTLSNIATNKWLVLGCAIVSEVSATLALRASVDDARWLGLVVAGYLGGFVFLALVLRAGMPVGVAYGIWAAVGVALTAVLAAFIFGDAFTVGIGVGIAIVIGGVLLVELGSHGGHETADEPKAPE